MKKPVFIIVAAVMYSTINSSSRENHRSCIDLIIVLQTVALYVLLTRLNVLIQHKYIICFSVKMDFIKVNLKSVYYQNVKTSVISLINQ